MYPPVVTKDPAAVEVEVQSAYLAAFPGGDRLFVPRAFGWAIEFFAGKYRDFQPIDAPYHDFEHTLQGTLCLARLLRGRQLARATPMVTQDLFELGLLAILMHDTGYLKQRGDTRGTGAKYTVTHVDRSARFAGEFLAEKGFAPQAIQAVQNMIHCTGVDAALGAIRFQSEAERIVGFALGTADLLGQMAAEDYVDKLPVLYAEFAEAAQFSGDKDHFVARYTNAEDLMQKTPEFWEKSVRSKLEQEFEGLAGFLANPWPDGPNYYLERVEANIERLRQRLVERS